jgi:hypothetical protein
MSLVLFGKNGTFAALFFAVVLCAACTTKQQVQEEQTVDFQRQFEEAYSWLNIAEPLDRQEVQPLVLAHYMPWFQKNGYHWSEGSPYFNPSRMLPDGRANIASHYYPLTGNYDSSDPAVLEYQLALMKIAGIDGVIFDWYGTAVGFDYRLIHEATQAMVEMIRKHGMKFVVCYEDQSVKHLVEAGVASQAQGPDIAKDTFEWMAQHWFSNDEYVKVDGRPLVMCFGPQHFSQKAEWDEIWADLPARPFFIDLDSRTSWADGSMNWSPMYMSTNGELAVLSLVRYLNNFYLRERNKPFVVGTAIPAFHDIYGEAGKTSYGYLAYSGGETFKLTWAAAERARANVIQIQTWNDYGEGTVVEPTLERGYESLEYAQDKRRQWEPDFPFNHSDLRIPFELYKTISDVTATQEQKAQVFVIYDLIFSGNVEAMRGIFGD